MSGIVLRGLDGSNPLGLLAALGLLDVVAQQEGRARLLWCDEGAWRPVLLGAGEDRGRLIDLVMEDATRWRTEPALALSYPVQDKEGRNKVEEDLKPPPAIMASFLRRLAEAATSKARRGVDLAAAFASDVVVAGSKEKPAVKPTALHFTAGQQSFLKMAKVLLGALTPEDIAESLFGPWRYARDLPVMRWDSTRCTDYALLARAPADDKASGVPGADWLALLGLTNFPVAPIRGELLTTGCTGSWLNSCFCWPLWSAKLGRDAARALIGMGSLARMSESERRARGIVAVFQSSIRRHPNGGRGNFSPSTSL